LPAEPPQIGDTPVIKVRQCATDGSHIRQAFTVQQASHHRIALEVAYVLKPAIAQQKVGGQQQTDDTVAKDRVYRQVTETLVFYDRRPFSCINIYVFWMSFLVKSSD